MMNVVFVMVMVQLMSVGMVHMNVMQIIVQMSQR